MLRSLVMSKSEAPDMARVAPVQVNAPFHILEAADSIAGARRVATASTMPTVLRPSILAHAGWAAATHRRTEANIAHDWPGEHDITLWHSTHGQQQYGRRTGTQETSITSTCSTRSYHNAIYVPPAMLQLTTSQTVRQQLLQALREPTAAIVDGDFTNNSLRSK